MEWTTSPSFKERLSVGFSHQQPTPDDGFESPSRLRLLWIQAPSQLTLSEASSCSDAIHTCPSMKSIICLTSFSSKYTVAEYERRAATNTSHRCQRL